MKRGRVRNKVAKIKKIPPDKTRKREAISWTMITCRFVKR